MAWYWHRVVPLIRAAGHEAIAVDLPGDDRNSGLAAYADIVICAIAKRTDVILVAQSLGGFTANENGIFDFAGNIWEWTDSCFVHHASHATGAEASITNCGVRVVEGRHRTYMTDFIRDRRNGGCAVGKPPLNLGFRLIRDFP